MSKTNDEFADDLAAAIADYDPATDPNQTALAAALLTAVSGWGVGGAAITRTAADAAAVMTAQNTFLQQAIAWYAGTATGGPNSDGRYELTDVAGNTRLLPSPAKLAAELRAIEISAEGPFSGRSAYDDEAEGFTYFSKDGADGGGGSGVLYRHGAGSGVWSDPLPFEGPPGKKVELQKSATHIQWRYEEDAGWTDLVALADLKGADGREVELGVTATHIQWRLADGAWANLVALSTLKGADGRELGIRVSGGHIQTRLGTDDWADLFDLSQAIGPPGPQGEGLHYDASGPFAERSDYDAEDAGFVFASTDGADGLGGVAVLYKRVGVSGWGDPVEIQGEKGDKGDDGDLLSLEGFVPYATIVTGSGTLIPGSRVSFEGTAAAILSLEFLAPVKGETYAVSNSGSANVTLNAGPSGVFKINPANPLSAGDRLVLEPGDGVALDCVNPVGPVFSQSHAAP